MAAISGTVLDKDGNGVARLVRVYLQSTGALVGSTTSAAGTGAFSVTTASSARHYAVCSDTVYYPYVPSFLLRGNGANGGTTFTDLGTPVHTVVRNNSLITTSTAQSKFNGSSIAFTGGADHLKTTAGVSSELTFGTGDFTIEMWVYRNTGGSYQQLIDWRPNSTDGFYPALYFDSTGHLLANLNSAVLHTSTGAVGLGATTGWHHLAWSRQGTNSRLFIDGDLDSTVTNSSNFLAPGVDRPCFGAVGYNTTAFLFDGYLAEVYVQKGVALYTGTFPLPTVPPVFDTLGANALVFDNLIPV